MVLFVGVNLAVIRLRRLLPDVTRPFRAPGSVRGVPVTAALGILTSVLLLFYIAPTAWLLGGLLVGVFTAGIACARFTVEFFREPDAQLQEFAARTGLSMGQWLTIPLIVLGLALIVRALARPALATGKSVPA